MARWSAPCGYPLPEGVAHAPWLLYAPVAEACNSCEATICWASVLRLAALCFLLRLYFLVPARPSELVPTKPSLYQVVV